MQKLLIESFIRFINFNLNTLISIYEMDIKTLLKNSEYIYNYDGECSICLEKDSSRLCRKLNCNHIFHCECIDKWFSNKNSCPICRDRLLKKDSNIIVSNTNFTFDLSFVPYSVFKCVVFFYYVRDFRSLSLVTISGSTGFFFGFSSCILLSYVNIISSIIPFN